MMIWSLAVAASLLSGSAHATRLRPDGDRDGDGLTNSHERSIGTSPRREDTDRDGWSDWWEVYYGGDPLDRRDSTDDDGDSLYQIFEDSSGCDDTLADTDGDGFDDWTEVYYGGDCVDPMVTP